MKLSSVAAVIIFSFAFIQVTWPMIFGGLRQRRFIVRMAVYVVGIGLYSLFVGPRWFEVGFLAIALIAAVLPWAWAIPVILSFLIVLGAAALNSGSGVASTTGLLIRTVVLGAVFYALLRLSTMLRDLVAGREAAEQVAILNERLRLGRDLHDVVVHSFTAIGLKAELADRLFTRNPDAAQSEVGQIQELASTGMAQVPNSSTAIGTGHCRKLLMIVRRC